MDVVTNQHTTFELPLPTQAAEPPRAYVAVLDAESPAVVPLPRGELVPIGRSDSSALRVDDAGASRLHLTLRWDGGDTVRVADQGSRNGTIVNGRRIDGEVEVPSGAEIAFGRTRLWLVVRPDVPQRADLAPIEERDLLAHAPSMLRLVSLVDRAARTDATTLLLGETGSGKEVIARRIHDRSARKSGPFVAVNCAAIPETLAESTLFGHERGAFTGASDRREGVFEAAHGGTLFLDEVGELSATTQARLLRVMEDRAVVRIGASRAVPVDVRLVAATNKDLDAMAARGTFRHDLLFRLDVVRLSIPPLRDRPEDVLPLSQRFLRELDPSGSVTFSPLAERALLSHRWPGNVRELRNRIERAFAVRASDVLRESDFEGLAAPLGRAATGDLRDKLDDVERDAILEALRACHGNQTRAAKRLGISRRTLLYRIERYGLKELAQHARR